MSIAYPGSIFREGSNGGFVGNVTSTSHGRFVDMGEYDYQVPSGRGQRATFRWGYVAIRLDRPLPHLVLEARAHSGWLTGELPIGVDKGQRLGLEGDFDEHFTLYSPAGYEADALYLFTPDLMALLIDEAGGKHVEIIDDWMFVCWQLGLDEVWDADRERLERIVDVVGTKLVAQGAAYTDPEGPAGAVAPQGQRLGRGLSSYSKVFWTSFAVVGGIIVLAILGTVVAFVVNVVTAFTTY